MNDTKETAATRPRGSVVKRFNLVLIGVYLLAILIAGPSIYFVTHDQVHAQAQKELSMLVDMVKSIQDFVAKDLRPYFMERGLFYSPGFSGIVASSHVAEHFKKAQPNYYIKNASDNPLNPANTTQPLEVELLNRFRMNRALTHWVQEGQLNGKTLLISSAPKVSKQECLKCHGARTEVPEEIRAQFPGLEGYNYQIDQVVGVSVVGVPIDDVQALALQRATIVLGVLTVLFGIVLVAVNLLVRGYLLTPILKITEAAHEISHGKLGTRVEMERNDEIGDLSRSVELVRRSFEKLIERMRKH